jgi:hypothetical protein
VVVYLVWIPKSTTVAEAPITLAAEGVLVGDSCLLDARSWQHKDDGDDDSKLASRHKAERATH